MLVVSTVAFTICFAICMMFAVIGIRLKASLGGLNETQFGLLVATPVLTGSLAVRALLLQRARELGLAEEHPGPDAEDAIIGRVLAGRADIEGVDLDAAASPLLQ